jgi:hypothetical protein
VCYDDKDRKVRLSLRQAEILEALASDEKLLEQGGGVPDLVRGKPQYVEPLVPSEHFNDTDTGQEWRHGPHLPSRVWPVHAGVNTREAMGYWIQRPPRCRAKHETEVRKATN